MPRSCLLILALAACGDDASTGAGTAVDAAADAPVVVAPGACTETRTFSLSGTGSEYIESVTLTTTPVTYCLTLDTTARTHPTYFDAMTETEPGPASRFALSLYDADGDLLSPGYDADLVTMETYATVHIEIHEAAVFDVRLVAHARESADTTPLWLGIYQIQD